MKVLYIGSDSQMCGAGLSMVKLIEEENKAGINVVPVVRKGFSQKLLSEKKIEHYVVNAQSWIVSRNYCWIKAKSIYVIKMILNIKCYFQYIKIIKKENPDIIHINAITTYVGAKAAIKMKKKVVWHIRELIEEDLNGTFFSHKKAYNLMKKAHRFIAISDCVENKYSKIVGKEKIVRIYNGIDENEFYSKNHDVFKNNKIFLTMAGRITKEKGQFLCLDALSKLLKKNSNVILQFAGTGENEELQRLYDFIEKEHINKNQVKFLGYIKNMNEVWKNTDIAIVYSKLEAFGRVTIEAKMAGAIVVGYNSGGTSELIDNGVNGFLFNNSNELLSSVEYILNNKEQAKKVALAGQIHACNNYTSNINCKKIIELFKSIIGDEENGKNIV